MQLGWRTGDISLGGGGAHEVERVVAVPLFARVEPLVEGRDRGLADRLVDDALLPAALAQQLAEPGGVDGWAEGKRPLHGGPAGFVLDVVDDEPVARKLPGGLGLREQGWWGRGKGGVRDKPN